MSTKAALVAVAALSAVSRLKALSSGQGSASYRHDVYKQAEHTHRISGQLLDPELALREAIEQGGFGDDIYEMVGVKPGSRVERYHAYIDRVDALWADLGVNPGDRVFFWEILYVQPEARGMGLGRDAVKRVESLVKGGGGSAIILLAGDFGFPEDTLSVDFWKRMGYRKFPIQHPEWSEARVMVKVLSPQGSPAMAPGYRSRQWVKQDWRSVIPRARGVETSRRCGAAGTRTKDDRPALCLPREVIEELQRTADGRAILRDQAKKKWRAPLGARIRWHPRIRQLHQELERRTPKDRPRGSRAIPAAKSALLLRGADLRGESLRSVALPGADLRGSLLPTQMNGVNLAGADLRGAEIPAGANISGGQLSGAVMDGARIASLTMGQANLSGASLRRSRIYQVNAQGVILSNADLSEAILEWLQLIDARFDFAVLRNSRINSSFFVESMFDYADLSRVESSLLTMSFCSIVGANLGGARFHMARFISCRLDEADLRGANLVKASLKGSSLRGARLDDSDFAGADLRDADLSETDLSRVRLSGAWYSIGTRLPVGVTPEGLGLQLKPT